MVKKLSLVVESDDTHDGVSHSSWDYTGGPEIPDEILKGVLDMVGKMIDHKRRRASAKSRDDGMTVKVVSLTEASAAFGHDHFIQVELFRDQMSDVPYTCIGTMNDDLICLIPSDWSEWVRR